MSVKRQNLKIADFFFQSEVCCVLNWPVTQGAVAGGLLGLIFPLWISIGAYNLPASPSTLPFPTNGCVADNATTITMTTAATALTSISTTAVAPPDEL